MPSCLVSLATTEGQRPAAGAPQCAAEQRRPAGLCFWPGTVRQPAPGPECCHPEQRAAAFPTVTEEEQVTGD